MNTVNILIYECDCGKRYAERAGVLDCQANNHGNPKRDTDKNLQDLLARVRALEAYLNEKEGLILFPGGL